MIDLFGHAGYLLIALGMYLLSRKDKFGWICRFIGESIWVYLGVYLGMSSIYIWGAIFMGIDLAGYYNWRKNEKFSRKNF